ncbi:MAG: phosphomannomutase [Rhizobiales bacterium]|nr:phosphomannomutase [Hyphomicrobiales bacterium]
MTFATSGAVRSSASPGDSVRFGTSGLRGPAQAFTAAMCDAYVGAFIDLAHEGDCGDCLYIAADKRESSPRIAAFVAEAAAGKSLKPVYLGVLPTPALAVYALSRRCLSIMVTGSHIPAEYNGLKFYRHDGELTKEDEPDILARLDQPLRGRSPPVSFVSGARDGDAAGAYVNRYRTVFPRDLLKGLRLGVDLHSGAGTILLAELLDSLGASVVAFGEARDFLAIDTEALDSDRLALYRSMLGAHSLDAIATTDGDGDRPLLIDEAGEQIPGDVLGILTARFLGIERVVTPVTSTSAIEATGWFQSVTRTRVGSPFVIATMAGEQGRVAGFEANGGFLLGCDIEREGQILTRLPTRDAVLPLIATLAEAVAARLNLSALVACLPKRSKLADRLTDIAPAKALGLLSEIAKSPAVRRSLDERLVDPVEIDLTDGVRLVCQDGSTVHFRRSGNAPEFRCYVETDERRETRALLQSLMHALAAHFEKPDAVERIAEAAQ